MKSAVKWLSEGSGMCGFAVALIVDKLTGEFMPLWLSLPILVAGIACLEIGVRKLNRLNGTQEEPMP